MESPRHALLLIGSPKATNSTSELLGTYLLEKLGNSGFNNKTAHAQKLMCSAEGQQAMLELVKASDLVVLAFPLYIDSLPAGLILTLEKIVQQQSNTSPTKKQWLLVIVNNGFPEASQNNSALAVCKRFAFEAGFDWAGGLSLGGGGAIGGKSLDKAGFAARNVRKALNLAAKDLSEGKVVSQEAVDLMAKPMVPKWLYLMVGNRNWKQWAKDFGSQDKMYNQP